MRKVVYGAACSLDGFIAADNGTLDWLHFSRDVERIVSEQWKRYDVVLMGRNTWVAGRELGGGAPIPGADTFVLSRTLLQRDVAGATVVGENAADFVQRLKTGPGKDICLMGGGLLAQSLFAADLIDEIGINIHPLLLGRGVPFFRDADRRIPLRLIDVEKLDGGCMMMMYELARRRDVTAPASAPPHHS